MSIKPISKRRTSPIPTSLEELTQPDYAGLLVTENPATSSPGLAFLMATIAHFGEKDYLAYWEDLAANGLVVASDWETAYYTKLQRLIRSGARSPWSSPTVPARPAEVIYAENGIG